MRLQNAFESVFRANIDMAIINGGHEDLSHYNGGTVLMTAYSAKEDEHALRFDRPLPGRTSEVIGLKTNAFYDGGVLSFELDDKPIETTEHRYEALEPEMLLTQPAITQQIKALEDELGVALFDRGGGHIALTPAFSREYCRTLCRGTTAFVKPFLPLTERLRRLQHRSSRTDIAESIRIPYLLPWLP
jgi:hypothetical protein